MSYDTGNPLGSTDPRDFSDNSENFDRAVNNTASATWTDRLGNSRTTLAGQIGYRGTGVDGAIESYAAGLVMESFSTIILYNNEFYRPSASATLPYTTTATTPDVDSNLVAVGDAVLRQDLANSTAGVGSDLVAHTGTSDTVTEALDKRTIYVGSVAEGISGLSVIEGQQYSLAGWHEKSGSYALADPALKGAGLFVGAASISKSNHNGGTIVSPTVPPVSAQAGATLSERVAAFLAGTGETDPTGSGVLVRPYEQTLYTTWFGHIESLSNAAPCFQKAIDISSENWEIVVPENAVFTESVTPRQRITIRGLKKQGQEIRGLFDGALFDRSAGQLWKNVFKWLTLNNEFNGPNASCIRATGYQLDIYQNSLRCDYGKAIHLLGNEYSVENMIRENYFFTCKNGIYAESNAFSNTDAYVLDNYFFGASIQESSVYWNIASGSTFRGNHYYGGATRYFMEMLGGINVSILDNYFEGNASRTPRLFISPGNTGSWTIGGNKFWKGDGAGAVNVFGETESLIKIDFTAGIKQQLTFTGNVFESGVNNVDVFRTDIDVNTGSHLDNSIVCSGNIYNGSYSLGVNVSRVVDLERGQFEFVHTDRSPTLGIRGVVERYTNSGFADSTVNLPNNDILRGKSFTVINETTVTTMNLSTSRTIVGKTSLSPGEKAEVTMRGSIYYIF